MADTATSGDRINELAEEFLSRRRAGKEASVEAYAIAHPELADEIRRLFPALLLMEELKPASGDATGPFDPAAVVAHGVRLDRLGDFRVLREVGRGGMGVVYEAEQESLGRRVALKVLATHALKDPTQVGRFEREARAAARLHHTNIVPVFGVGEEQGLHYYVMQFIQGLGLDEVIAEVKRFRSGASPAAPVPETPGAVTASRIARSLLIEQFPTAPPPSDAGGGTETLPAGDSGEAATPRAAAPEPSPEGVLGSSGLSSASGGEGRYWRSVARVGLQVAWALEYAHIHGVLHRDVKPSNLLLDPQGTAWVADFGLAKAAEGDDLTHTGDIVGTIRYMAPERFRGRCDARSDIYALGLTLYEMLSLRPAFDRADRQALIQQVMEDEPPRLRTLCPPVPRDLETVVHKAIASDPAGRYPTAAALAEDLALFLDGKPIRARSIGPLERCWKWAKRRPAVAALLAGLVVAILAGLSAVTWQWRAAVTARDEARRTLQMANEAVDTSFTQVSEEHLLEEPGMQPLREKLLKLSLPYYRAFAERGSDDPAFKVQLANAYLRWGMITGQIGSRDEAKRLLRTAADHFEGLRGARPAKLDVLVGLARSYQELAFYQVFTDQTREGAQSARRAAEIWAAVVRERPNDPEPAQMLGRSHDLAGLGFGYASDFAAAKPELQTAIAVLTDASSRFPDHPEARRKLARALNNLGVVLRLTGELRGAEQTHARASELLAALLTERPSSTRLRNDSAAAGRLFGQVRFLLGSLRRAEAALVSARRLIEGVVRENPDVIEYRYLRGEINSYLGQVRAEQGQTSLASASLQEDMALQRELLVPNPDLTDNLLNLAESGSFLAGVERETGRFDDAARLAEEALGIMEKLLRAGTANPSRQEAHFHTAIESARLATRPEGSSVRERDGALRALLREWETQGPGDLSSAAGHRLASEGYLVLAETAAKAGSPFEALKKLDSAEAALAGALRLTPDQPRLVALRVRIETTRGFTLVEEGKRDRAAEAADRAVGFAEPVSREDPAYLYDLACALALRARLDPSAPGPPEDAVKALRGATGAGFDNAYKLEHDDRLAVLRGRDDFREAVRQAKGNAEAAIRSGDRPAP